MSFFKFDRGCGCDVDTVDDRSIDDLGDSSVAPGLTMLDFGSTLDPSKEKQRGIFAGHAIALLIDSFFSIENQL
jgi:hypothetical protein